MKELWLRIFEPLNTFWRRFRVFMLAVAAICFGIADYTDVIIDVLTAIGEFSNILLLSDVKIPKRVIHYAEYGRVVGMFGAVVAQLTVRSTERLAAKKHKAEIEDKLGTPPAPGVYNQDQ